MGFTAMGFFFILFPEDESTIITKNKQKTNLSPLKSINTLFKPSYSTHLFSKAQFIISICLLLIFITFLLFTISTFEPSPRTQLSKSKSPPFQQHALQGMGTLYRKGTRSMSDLIVAHVIESVTVKELKLFMKLIYRSKISSKSDILFIFPTKSVPFENTIIEENTSFLKLIHGYKENSTNFDPTHFLISSNKVNASEEPIWGRKKQRNFSEEDNSTESSTRWSYGSVIGFYTDELDPENSLSGFMDHVPMSLRRWACYPLLFGRIRRNFEKIMLVNVKEMVEFDDSLSRFKNVSHDSVLVYQRKKSHKKQANPGIIMGGLRGIRRLSNGMLIEIVRESMKKKKNSVTEFTLFNQLGRNEPLKVMISGAPASGKGTQCELIVQKFGLVHISTGDLLRAELSAGTDIGNKAREYMKSGRLVPDEIVTAMVTARLSREDAKEKGWLLDGYPRTLAQAESLEKLNIRPDIYIVLDVPDEILIDRCVGRRLDPLTGKIYHVTNFPPETEDIKATLITRPDDTEEKVKSRLQIYKQNAEAILPVYSNIMNKVDGNRSKDAVFAEIDSLLSHVQKEEQDARKSEASVISSTRADMASLSKDWRGIPTRLNNIPHSREIREYFYTDVLQATQRAINDGKTRLKIEINIPELNPAMDVYRIGTLMELIRVLALSFADDGKRVKVCVQGSMGEGALAGMPLQLAGSRKILEFMDWGDYGALGTFVNIGSIGGKEVDKQDDLFILVAPQNAVGNCIIDDMRAMTDAAGNRPVILVNPKLQDLPGSSGIMQTMGRDKRLEYASSFELCYQFRLLYYAGTQYPIMGALRMSYPYPYELYKRVDESPGKEKYVSLATFAKRPNVDEMNDAFEGKSRNQRKKAEGFWGFLSGIL